MNGNEIIQGLEVLIALNWDTSRMEPKRLLLKDRALVYMDSGDAVAPGLSVPYPLHPQVSEPQPESTVFAKSRIMEYGKNPVLCPSDQSTVMA